MSELYHKIAPAARPPIFAPGALCRSCGACHRVAKNAPGSRARSSPRLARARGAAARRLAPPMRNRLSSRARHPSANAACMARSRCLPSPCNAASRCLPRTGGGLRSGPARRRPSPCALSAHVRFCGARPAHLTVSKVSAYLRNLAQLWTPHETVVKQVFRRVPKTLAERAAHE